MRVLVVHNRYREPGGEDAVVEHEIELLRARGNEVAMHIRDNTETDTYRARQHCDLAKNVVWSERTRKELEADIATFRPDVVHVHNTFIVLSPSVYAACKDAGVPVVQTLHNYRLLCPRGDFLRDGRPCEQCVDSGLWKGVAYGCYRDSRVLTGLTAAMLAFHRWRRTLDDVELFLAPSQFTRRKFVESGRISPDKIVVKPHFVDTDPGARRAPGDYAIYVGRLSSEKGVRTLLSAWHRLAAPVPLKIVGDGDLLQELRSAAAPSAAPVTFTGRLPKQHVFDAIKLARFLIFPSECYETFGLTIAEAFACGVPVIASAIGAGGELVSPGRTGLYFSPGDASNLARAVEWAWDRKDEMLSMGHAARKEYECQFTACRNYDLLISAYDRAISFRRSACKQLAVT